MRFAYRLAKELGYWDVHAMLQDMTWGQLVGWHEYSLIEPFGEERRDLRMGTLAAILVNVNKKRTAKAAVPSDFILDFTTAKKVKAAKREPITKPSTWQRVKNMAKVMMGGPVE